MAGISTSIELQDRMSGALNRITASLYNTTSAFHDVNVASSNAFDSSAVQAITQELYNYENQIQDIQSQLINTTNRLEEMENETRQVREQASSLENAFDKVAGAVAAIGIGTMIKNQVADAINYASDLTEVQNVVDTVFGQNSAIDEWSKSALNAVGLNELSAKQFAGTMGAMLSSSGVAQDQVESMSMSIAELAGNMASFYNLDAEDAFNKLRSGISGETEPLKALGINMSVANLEAYALSQGIETSFSKLDQGSQTLIRYNYLLSATANAQGDFARTSGSYANQVKLLKENWSAFTGELATNVLPMLSMGISMLNQGVAFISENWAIISPILAGAVAMIGAYTAALIVGKTVQLGAALVTGIHTAMTSAWTVATFAEIAAQQGLNAALYACPITWIIIAIIAVIAAIYAIVAAVNKLTDSSVSATGLIAGAFAVLGSHVINTFLVPTWNMIASFINFLGNVFNDPVSSIKILFYDMALTIIGYITNMASAIESVINKIPGVTVDITSGLDNFQSQLEAAQQKVKDESGWVEYVGKMDYIDYGAAAQAGYQVGEGIEDKVSGFFDGSAFDTSSLGAGFDSSLTGMSTDLSGINGNTAAIADSVDISNENVEWMRDLAEQEAINRFTTASVKVDMGGVTNNVNQNTDLDGLVAYLSDGVGEALQTTAEGVHC